LALPKRHLQDVPVHKTGSSFTKPVDPLMGEAIEAWQKARPLQPKMLDRKTAEQADFLFAYRARRVASHYINDAVIPVLCAKAGSPPPTSAGRSPATAPGPRSRRSSTTPRSR
jgi:hypothetical protein